MGHAHTEPPADIYEERITPLLIPLEHWTENIDHAVRYVFAKDWLKGDRGLDAGCGNGYGTEYLASHTAAQFVGIDASPDAVSFAVDHYPTPNLRFLIGDVGRLPFKDESFDIAVAFEIVEHVLSPQSFLAEIHRVLKADGVMVVSTPNRLVSSPDGRPRNPFHVREFDPSEFREMLDRLFDRVQLQGQDTKHLKPFSRTYHGRRAKFWFVPGWARDLLPARIRKRLIKQAMKPITPLTSIRRMTADSAQIKEMNVLVATCTHKKQL